MFSSQRMGSIYPCFNGQPRHPMVPQTLRDADTEFRDLRLFGDLRLRLWNQLLGLLVLALLCFACFPDDQCCNGFGDWLSSLPIAFRHPPYLAADQLYVHTPPSFVFLTSLQLAGAYFTTDAANSFYQIGKGFPFYYGVKGARRTLFGSLPDDMLENAFVIFAYLVFFMGIFMLFGIGRAERLWKTLAHKSWLHGFMSSLAGGEHIHLLRQDSNEEEEEYREGDETEMKEKASNDVNEDDKEAVEEKVEEKQEDVSGGGDEDESFELEGYKELRKAIVEDKYGWWIWMRRRFGGRENHQTSLLMAMAAFLLFLYALLYIGILFFISKLN